MQLRLCRRSDLSPSKMTGVVGQKCNTSGYHWIRLAKEQLNSRTA